MSKHVVLTRKAAMTLGALHGFLKPRLAQDAKINLVPILAKLTSKNFGQQKPTLIKSVKHALDGKLAKDASVEGLATLLDALEGEKAMDDPLPLETEENGGLPPLDDKSMDDEGGGPDAGAHAAILEFLTGKISDEDMAAVQAIISGEAGDEDPDDDDKPGEDEPADNAEMAEKIKENQKPPAKDKYSPHVFRRTTKDEPPDFKGKPEVGGGMGKDAVNKAIADAVKAARVEAGAVRDAERFVRPWVGELTMAHDSAVGVYKTALKALGVDVKDVHPSAYRAILERTPVPSNKPNPDMAHDSAAAEDFAKRFPHAAAIKFC